VLQKQTGGSAYGAKYDDLFRATPHRGYDYALDEAFDVSASAAGADVSLGATWVYTRADADLARRTMARRVPIPPCASPEAWWSAADAAALGVAFPKTNSSAADPAAAVRAALLAAGLRELPWSEALAATWSADKKARSHAAVHFVVGDGERARAAGALGDALGEHRDDLRGFAVQAESIHAGRWEVHVILVSK